MSYILPRKWIARMDPQNNKGRRIALWNKLTGDPATVSMENRAFNYVCIITFPILLYCLVFDLFIGQGLMCYVLMVILSLLGIIYYRSRIHQQYQSGIITYAVCSYLILIINYYNNSGILGPTIGLFFLSFHLLVAIGKPKHTLFWICLHVAVVSSLLYSEYTHPEWVPDTYLSKKAWFLDIGSCSIIALAFIYTITNYLRRSFNKERIVAEARALSISEQNQMLEKVNEEKNKLFSIVSHDLRSPLDAIRGYLELLSENLLKDNERAKVEAELLEQTKYTSDLLLNLLSWAKAQMHGVTVNAVPLSLKEQLEKMANNKISAAAKKGIKLTYSIDPSIEVVADRDMLDIVLRNLINNAIKFTATGGDVVIRAIRKGDKAVLSVRDTGIGIPEEKQEEIFTLRTRSTYGTNQEKGIGLGLMMCKEFMDYQHGSIWFESKEGAGTTFYIALPLTRLV